MRYANMKYTGTQSSNEVERFDIRREFKDNNRLHRPHDDVIIWKHFPRNWPFVRGIHQSPVNSPHKGQWRGALMFSLISAWINDWVNNREAGDLRRYRTHYDVIVMHLISNITAQRTHGVMITSLIRQNDTTTSLWRNNDVTITIVGIHVDVITWKRFFVWLAFCEGNPEVTRLLA